jgi:malate dehydrogenase (oxaloacetate-decarboxylating)(NADP+)
VVFAEGEEEKSVRAALAFRAAGYGTPVLIGREERVKQTMERMGLSSDEDLETHNARLSSANKAYTDFLYGRQQRRGALYRDCQRMVNQDRNIFGACMVAMGDADAMVTGLTRNYYGVLADIRSVLDPEEGSQVLGLTLLLARNRTLFLADTAVHELPTSEQLADFAVQTAAAARRFGHDPRVALISFSNFGNPDIDRSHIVRDAVAVLDSRKVDFEYDGEMGADVALNAELMRLYPFCRLSGPANVLIMPGLHSAHASTRLMHELGGGTVIGPILIGLSKPVQILPQGATVNDIVNMAAMAAHDA